MIWGVKGKVRKATENTVVVETSGGVIYKAMISKATRQMIPPEGTETEIYTALFTREDSMDLFGFATEEEKKLFDLLNTVSGVGPKAALSILSTGPIGEMRAAIAEGKVEALTKSVGIGKKTAERIVVELRDKVVAELTDRVPTWDDDVYEALVRLGYPKESAKRAVSALDPNMEGTRERLREALKLIK